MAPSKPKNLRVSMEAERSPMRRAIGIWIMGREPGVPGVSYLLPDFNECAVEVSPEASVQTEPPIWLLDGEAQLLMDSLWRAGLRPSDDNGTPGQLAAMKNHIGSLETIIKQALPAALRKD